MDFHIIETIEAAIDHGVILKNADKNYITRPGTDEALHLFDLALDAGDKMDIDDAAGLIASEFETQGFINGFRAGMKLAFEIWAKQ